MGRNDDSLIWISERRRSLLNYRISRMVCVLRAKRFCIRACLHQGCLRYRRYRQLTRQMLVSDGRDVDWEIPDDRGPAHGDEA